MRTPVLAAGGIVLRQEETPLIAVVRLRKRNEWVLPKGKLDDGETPRAAAEREVMEETGHDVSVHEFLGTLVYESGGRSKVVHYWRMETDGEQARDLMDDVRAVDWLPLDAAVDRLSRGYERAFLANVGPLALESAALDGLVGRPKARPPSQDKRRGRPLVGTPPSLTLPIQISPIPASSIPASPQPDPTLPVIGQGQHPAVESDGVEPRPSVQATEYETAPPSVGAGPAMPAEGEPAHQDVASSARGPRRNLVQRVRNWLRRTGTD